MSSTSAIIRASGRPSYSGGGQGSPSVYTKNTFTHTHTRTHKPGAEASRYQAAAAAAKDDTMKMDDTGSDSNPFIRGGAVQRSPPTKSANQGSDVSSVLSKEGMFENQQMHTALPNKESESKGSLGSTEEHVKGLENPVEGNETCVFARPMRRETEEKCASARPSGKESEADVSDCSLGSTASSASGTRKRRQPYLLRPGKAKKTAVEDNNVLDPYVGATVTKAKKDLPTVENIQHELKNCTSVDIVTRIFESMSTIEKAAESSRSSRGAHTQNLRLAARSVVAAASELVQRSSNLDVERLKKENDELRSELANLKSELTKLTAEVTNLRQGDAGREKRAKQAGEPRIDKDPLVRHIAALMDEKLSVFREEVLPKNANRPSLGKKAEITPEKSQPKGKKSKKGKKTLKAAPQPGVSLAETPLKQSGCPDATQTATGTWAEAVGRKSSTAKLKTSTSKKDMRSSAASASASGLTGKAKKIPPAPKKAVVSVTLTDSATVNYATAMETAKKRINLADCGISQVRQKKAITGGLILEIPGPDSTKKADALAERLREALADMGVRIARPVKTGEIRVLDLDESITKQDVAMAIAEAGECLQEEVKVGEIRYSTTRLGTAWVRCPITAVRKLALERHLRVGWVSARVRVLAARQLQCFRCLEFGHVRKQCFSAVDRSLCCYSCGETGHKARDCKAIAPKCPVCADLGRPADHRLGGKKCNPPKKSNTKGGSNVPSESRGASKIARLANQPAEKANKTQNTLS